jgi:hypothetical protein
LKINQKIYNKFLKSIKLTIKDKNKITYHSYIQPTSGMLLVDEVSDDLDGK